ncbi:MAG TPA: hypothetical protein VIL11_02800 [Limnochordales bacterium]
MSRKTLRRCQVCGRAVATDAVVKLEVAGRRGPQRLDWLKVAAPLEVCPWCARNHRFAVRWEPLPPPGEAQPPAGLQPPAGPGADKP